jgi:hypothetical protein
MSWLDELLDITDEAETPRQWITWGGLAAIAAVAGPNMFLNMQYYKLSPNIYALLIGESGLGKGLAPYIARSLVDYVGTTRVIEGRNSIQAIISELSRTKSSPDRPLLKDSRGFVCSGEIANLFIKDPQALTIFTEWYDVHYAGSWKNTLKGDGAGITESLKNVNITLFGAASPAHFKDFISERDIQGGFIGRTLLVFANKKHRINSLIFPTEKSWGQREVEYFGRYLKQISELRGEFGWELDAAQAADKWYREYQETRGEDKTGTANRMKDHVFKVAMLLSLAHSLSMKIRVEDFERALNICTGLAVNVNKALMGKGNQALASATALVIKDLIELGKISRTMILRKHWGELDAFDLDKIQTTLLGAKAMTVETSGDEMYFVITPEFRNQYEAYKKKE